MLVAITNIIAFLGGSAVIGGLIWIARNGHADRDEEEAARAFFDEHGHWPDEEPGSVPNG